MRKTMAYQVVITTAHQVNIILSNKQKEHLRNYSHFVSSEDAAGFADKLEQTLAKGTYSELDKCPLCDQPIERQNRLSLLTDGRIVHQTCMRKALRRGELTKGDYKEYLYRFFSKDTPVFDYSNLTYETTSEEFRYAVQIISKAVIHLYLIEPGNFMKRHFCLTYDECLGLIQEIRDKLDQLRKYLDAAVGKCACCGATVNIDNTYYQMASGEVIHGVCMDRFVRSWASTTVRFPTRKFHPKDVFGHVRLFGESSYPCFFLNNT